MTAFLKLEAVMYEIEIYDAFKKNKVFECDTLSQANKIADCYKGKFIKLRSVTAGNTVWETEIEKE